MKNTEMIFKEIALRHNTSVEEVKKEMQKAIDSIFTESSDLASYFNGNGKPPTVEEFFDFLINYYGKQ